MATTGKITGFGGVFLRANDPAALYAWYRTELGLASTEAGFSFAQNESGEAQIAVALFARGDSYFPLAQPAMLNLKVDDLHALLDRLAAQGIAVDPRRESYEYGQFGWFTDPEGNRVELWQPA